jgi:hypothetical protein
MARNIGKFTYSFNYEVQNSAPLDSRILVENISDLITENTWLSDNSIYLYNGLVVSVTENNGLYMLTDADNYTSLSSWKKLDADLTSVDVNQQIDDANITNYITNPVFTQELNKKQDKISDLQTIRSNAEKATTAVQPNQVSSLAVTGINMNGTSKGTNGTVDLGTVITGEHLTEVVSGNTTGHTANQLYGKNSVASRSVISDPNEYNHLLKFTGLKENSTLGLTNAGQYSSVVGVRAWNDNSGGPAHEFAYTQNGKVYHRYGNSTGDTSWQNWNKIVENSDLNGYVTTGTTQTISGVKKFTNGIEIGQGSSGSTSIISNQIDSGELKVWHSGTTKGFILRTNKKTNPNASIFPLELLTTNNSQSYQYNFPTQTGGIVALSAKINGNVYTPSTTGGTIDLGNGYLTPTTINNEVLFENLEEVTYNELLNLVKTCSLVKGRNYRIIDYITTTTQEGTQSAGKPFDVIVTALSNNTLDENAKVCHPKGIRKTYGGALYINGYLKTNETVTPYNWSEITLNSKLKKVIYDYESLNNNTLQNEYKIVQDGFTVNASGGTLNIKIAQKTGSIRPIGVELCDKNKNNEIVDCDYHLSDINSTSTTANYYVSPSINGSYFVRILFIKPGSNSNQGIVEIGNYTGHYFNENDLSKWVIKYDVHNDTNKYLWADATNGKGVIYYMKDEFDNECPYDFKNIKFKRTKQWVDENNLRDPNDELKFNETEKYFYTFDWNGTDDSLCKGTYKCEQNKIEKLLSGKQQQLNNNIFLGNGNANNKICANSKNNVIGVDSYNNEFGVNFQNNIILQKFTYNSIGNGFQNNVCRTTFRYNTIGHLVSGNKFLLSFTNNIVGESVKNNTFNGNTQYNTIGAIVQNNDFGGMMYYCNIGINLQYCKPTSFPDLYRVTIEPGILAGTSSSPIDLSTISVNDKPFTEAILNKKTDGQWSNKGILLFKDNDDNYYVTSDGNNNEGIGDVTINVLYSELVALRSMSGLTPGCKYRITDYVTTTSQENTQSANHPFDIIVEALTENTLSEDTKACLHEGDTYFSEHNAKLGAWEIKYCLDNDTDRFAWASSQSGKGVIYYMKDEFNNECPYDFKNIMFIRYKLEAPDINAEFSYDWQREMAKHINEAFESNTQSYIWSGIYEHGKDWETEIVHSNNTHETKAFFTFSKYTNDIVTDNSINGNCYNNVIKNDFVSKKLNNNIFILNRGSYCYENTFGNICKNNTFGDECNNNTFGNVCYENTFGNICKNNTFGDSCYNNTLSSGCYNITFGNICISNSFGNSCNSNSFGNSCDSNSFGNYCNANSFGNYCSANSFGNNCFYNSFGDYCFYNSFGDYCSTNSFGDYCHYNGFYDDSSYSYSEDLDDYIGDGEKLNYVQYVTLNEGCHHLLFHTSEVINEENKVRNITVTKGVNPLNITTPLTIEIPVTNNEYELKIARNSSGEIKMYCEADLIN